MMTVEPTSDAADAAATTETAANTTPTATTQKPRKPNAWISHVKSYRLENATTIKEQKLSCSQISKLAKSTYQAKARCTTCGK